MAELLSAALVGCGRMGAITTQRTLEMIPPIWLPLSHAEAMEQHKGIQLKAICDVNKDTLDIVGAKFSIDPDRRFRNVSELLEREKPDILAVATRTPGRGAILEAAIKAGVRGIHTEKPLTQNLCESEAILQDIEGAGIAITYGTLRRYMMPYRVAKTMIAEGQIGMVREVTVSFGYHDLLMWTHPHSVDLLMFFGGTDVESVSAVCDFYDSYADDQIIDCDPRVVFAHMHFSSGILGTISSASGMDVRISGTEGIINIAANGTHIEIYRRDKSSSVYFSARSDVDVPLGNSGTLQAFFDLHDALLTGSSAARSISAREIALNQRLLWTIATSGLRNGRQTSPDEVPEGMTITGKYGDFFA